MATKCKMVLIIVFVIAGLLIGNLGCSKSGSTTTNPATTTPPATSSVPNSGNTLGDILGRAAGVTSVKYDMVMTIPGSQATSSTIWVKKNKMRMEMTVQGPTSVILMDVDAKTMYTYMASQNTAIKMAFNPTTTSAVADAQSLQSYNPKTVGTETIDGKVCTIIEYTVNGTTTRTWIWQDRGLPVKIEMTTTTGKVTTEYKNYDFTDIPDSMFELPAGVQIMPIPGQ